MQEVLLDPLVVAPGRLEPLVMEAIGLVQDLVVARQREQQEVIQPRRQDLPVGHLLLAPIGAPGGLTQVPLQELLELCAELPLRAKRMRLHAATTLLVNAQKEKLVITGILLCVVTGNKTTVVLAINARSSTQRILWLRPPATESSLTGEVRLLLPDGILPVKIRRTRRMTRTKRVPEQHQPRYIQNY